jgi:hypothetical protein
MVTIKFLSYRKKNTKESLEEESEICRLFDSTIQMLKLMAQRYEFAAVFASDY